MLIECHTLRKVITHTHSLALSSQEHLKHTHFPQLPQTYIKQTLTHTHTHTLSTRLFPPLSPPLSLSLSLSLSLTHTHTHTHTHTDLHMHMHTYLAGMCMTADVWIS